MKKKNRVILFIAISVLAILAIPAFIYATFFITPAIEDYQNAEPFDSKKWKESEVSDEWPSRLRMVDDLLKTHTLVGKQRIEIEELLGKSDTTPYFKNYDLVYWLGPERGAIRIDSEWLVFKMGTNQACVEAKIVTD